jgi:hypothetical protein
MIVSSGSRNFVKIGQQCRTLYMKTRVYVCIVDSFTKYSVARQHSGHYSFLHGITGYWTAAQCYAVCTLLLVVSAPVPHVSDTDSHLMVPVYVNL